MTEFSPAPAAVTPDSVPTPAAPADTVQSADTTPVSPQAETPAGKSEEHAATPESQEKQLTPGELARKERNRERWRQMKADRHEAKRRAERAEAELYRIKNAQPPDFAAIADPDEALATRTAFKIEQGQAGKHEAELRDARNMEQAVMRQAYDTICEDGRERLSDWDQVVNERTPVHSRAVSAIIESEKAGEILYHLGKNPDEAKALYQKFEASPAQAFIELGRMEQRLSAPVAKKVSTAPKPAAILSGGMNPLVFDANTAGVGDMASHLRKAGVIR